jgi:hypothetical protein
MSANFLSHSTTRFSPVSRSSRTRPRLKPFVSTSKNYSRLTTTTVSVSSSLFDSTLSSSSLNSSILRCPSLKAVFLRKASSKKGTVATFRCGRTRAVSSRCSGLTNSLLSPWTFLCTMSLLSPLPKTSTGLSSSAKGLLSGTRKHQNCKR